MSSQTLLITELQVNKLLYIHGCRLKVPVVSVQRDASQASGCARGTWRTEYAVKADAELVCRRQRRPSQSYVAQMCQKARRRKVCGSHGHRFASHGLSDSPQSDELLRPVFMGCSTKNTKVITIALTALQRLITLHAVPQSAVPTIISTMNECVVQGVDIQLRVLQTLLSLITNFPAIHGGLLGDVSTVPKLLYRLV